MSSAGLGPDIPVIMGPQGAVPTPPATLLQTLLALVAATNPGYTANLPGSLVEDISSTDVGALSIIDSARVELINSLTPLGANLFLLNLLAQIYGVVSGVPTNTAVFVVFSGTVGFTIPKGFSISDGAHLYVIQDGGIIGSNGQTIPLFAVAQVSGSWAVPANSVVNLVSSVPSNIVLSVTNPLAGTPAASTETNESFRSRVLQAGLAASQGMTRYLKTLLSNVPGVQPRLVSVRQPVNVLDQWQVIVGGTGDPYQVANAIFQALFDVTDLVGSSMNVTAFTNASPGVVTTDKNHGLTTGNVIAITGATPALFNNAAYTITVINNKQFSVGVDTTAFGTYVGSGVVTPNARNQTISIYDFPDTYSVNFVVPPQQTVLIGLTWNTTATNIIANSTIQSLGAAAIAGYINTIPVGYPINLFEMQAIFSDAIAAVVPPQLLSKMIFTVTINGVITSVDPNTGLYESDPESYFQIDPTQITIIRG